MNSSFNPTKLKQALLLYFILFGIFGLISTRVPQSTAELPSMLSLFTAWIGACIGIALVYLLSRVPDTAATLRGLIIGGLIVDIACNFAAFNGNSAVQTLRLPLISMGNLGMLAAATGVGVLVARGLQKPNYLLMAAVVGAVTDIFSVYAGPSKQILDASTYFPYVSFQWGVVGAGGVIPCVGEGDFIFLALYFVGTRRFGLSDRKTLIAMSVAFAIGFLSSYFSPRGIPALPFMALMLLLVHGPDLKAQMRTA